MMTAMAAARWSGLVVSVVLVSACSSSGMSSSRVDVAATPSIPSMEVASPSPATAASAGSPPATTAARPLGRLTAAELSAWGDASAEFIARFDASLHSPVTPFASFTEDAAILDPSNGDFRIAPRAVVVERWLAFASAFPDYRVKASTPYVARDAIASLADVAGVWPTDVPAPHDAYTTDRRPLLKELRVFRFVGDVPTTRATTLELWYRVETDEYQPEYAAVPGDPCKVRATCAAKIRALADRIATAWASGDEARIAALYRDDATRTDSVLGLEARGRSEIARSAAGAAASCTFHTLYIQRNGGDPIASDNRDPEGGKVLGLAFVGSCLPSRATGRVDLIRSVLFGHRVHDRVDLDPAGLIATDETFYAPDSLIAAGLAP